MRSESKATKRTLDEGTWITEMHISITLIHLEFIKQLFREPDRYLGEIWFLVSCPQNHTK